MESKIECKYGLSCYQKNKEHKKVFSHPGKLEEKLTHDLIHYIQNGNTIDILDRLQGWKEALSVKWRPMSEEEYKKTDKNEYKKKLEINEYYKYLEWLLKEIINKNIKNENKRIIGGILFLMEQEGITGIYKVPQDSELAKILKRTKNTDGFKCDKDFCISNTQIKEYIEKSMIERKTKGGKRTRKIRMKYFLNKKLKARNQNTKKKIVKYTKK